MRKSSKKINKRFMVIGLGRFGSYVAKTLVNSGFDVLATDVSIDVCQSLSSEIPNCVACDASNINSLKQLDVKMFDNIVVAIGNNLQASILTVTNLNSLGANRITVRADQESYKKIFMLLGATQVIIPEEESAISLANSILSDSLLDYKALGGEYALVSVAIGHSQEEPLKALNLRKNFGINIVGIQKSGVADKFFIPGPDDKLLEGDTVIVVGTKTDIVKFDKFLN